MRKRGVMGLSMTTIIIIIMGITILTLGLVWISGIFTDLTGITDDTFDTADGIIGDLNENTDEGISLSPSSVTLGQGETEQSIFSMNHQEAGEVTVTATVEVNTIMDGDEEDFLCVFADTGETESKEYSLDSGEGASITLVMKDLGSDVGTMYSCVVTAEGLSGGDTTDSITITIE